RCRAANNRTGVDDDVALSIASQVVEEVRQTGGPIADELRLDGGVGQHVGGRQVGARPQQCLGAQLDGFVAGDGDHQRTPHGGQHSMTLTARPPREVSLYLIFMSAPVSRIVLIALSSDTLWLPSPRTAMRAALMALLLAIALRSMQGIWTRPPTGSQVRPRLCSMPISAAFSTWAGVPPRTSHSPAAAIAHADPTSPWQPTSAPEIEALPL